MHVNAGDTAWMLTSTALVFFMMPGLASHQAAQPARARLARDNRAAKKNCA